jgi:thiamine-monophosphate kinase
MGEFELIEKFFSRPSSSVLLGNGDDCALIQAREGQVLAVSTDMLVSGRHFFADVDAHALGWKALAVNLSDLAAMAALPRAFTLALALPQADPLWLQRFADGLFECADLHGCELIGGDTTKGPLTISITVFGDVRPDAAVKRGGAAVGDDIWVSGELGGAALALAFEREQREPGSGLLGQSSAALRRRLHYPAPRIALALALAPLIHAMLDLSDGLVGDLQHLLDRSGCGAAIREDHVPKPAELLEQPAAMQRRLALSGGDDYELCFTAAPEHRVAIEEAGRHCAVAVSRIGRVTACSGLAILDQYDRALSVQARRDVRGFDHFV